MFFILGWIIYGLFVGLVAKALHPGKDPVGLLPTLGIGIAGSYVGGFVNWLLGWGTSPFSSSGIIMGIVGGVICCWVYSAWQRSQTPPSPPADSTTVE